ncbi:MAG TPA: PLP-dependent aspartate aminotransferase family protein [Longimicrobiaceae bacterium]|nr:PLP-dependent aspartate aminotransferase family protein [Longimicrobiaceae bacterium]
MAERQMGRSTRAVHAGDPPREAGGPVVTPIHQTSTFFSAPGGGGEVRYTRYGNNPTQVALESRMCALEEAEACLAVGSGMAAISTALLACLGAGDHILAADALYGGTRVLLENELSRLGVTSTYVDFQKGGWEDQIQESTRVLLIEIPTNPLLRVPDISSIAEIGHSRGLQVVVDATFATPMNCRPLEHGADLVVHSATKYLGGHSDLTAGIVCGGERLIGEARRRARSFGPALDPHAAWLLERGIKTLAVRMDRHNANGMEVSRWCERHPAIARVNYPGLPTHPDHKIAKDLLNGFGGMMALELRDGAAADSFVNALRLAKMAPSLGGVETLVSEPRFTSHAAMTADERSAAGMPDGFVRFSLGIEDAEDIIADIQQALESGTRESA